MTGLKQLPNSKCDETKIFDNTQHMREGKCGRNVDKGRGRGVRQCG